MAEYIASFRTVAQIKRYRAASQLLKVLAHPTRLAILDAVSDKQVCVTDVCELLDLPQPNISQHLSVLRSEGIVDFTQEGKRRCYFLVDPDRLKPLVELLVNRKETEHE